MLLGVLRRDALPSERLVELALAVANAGRADVDLGAVPERRLVGREARRAGPAPPRRARARRRTRRRARRGRRACADRRVSTTASSGRSASTRRRRRRRVVGAEALADVAERLGDVCRARSRHDARRAARPPRARARTARRRRCSRSPPRARSPAIDRVAPGALVVSGLGEVEREERCLLVGAVARAPLERLRRRGRGSRGAAGTRAPRRPWRATRSWRKASAPSSAGTTNSPSRSQRSGRRRPRSRRRGSRPSRSSSNVGPTTAAYRSSIRSAGSSVSIRVVSRLSTVSGSSSRARRGCAANDELADEERVAARAGGERLDRVGRERELLRDRDRELLGGGVRQRLQLEPRARGRRRDSDRLARRSRRSRRRATGACAGCATRCRSRNSDASSSQ